ncbi:MAG: ABC transporter substrate-binding protein [Alphaproteobacteria bacterium]
MTRRFRLSGLIALIALACAATGSPAATLRWAGTSDAGSLDPHSLAEAIQLAILGNVYDGLVRRTVDLQPAPGLATSWRTVTPTTWRFELRREARFADGTPFDADDVVFSFNRALGPTSGVRGLITMVAGVDKVDAHTVDFRLHAPDLTFPLAIPNVMILSKRWAEANGAVEASNPARRIENHATRNANGTGPFRIVERQQDQRTTFEPNPNWWGKPEHGITRAEFRPIASSATRIAALLSKEVDLIFPVPPQAAPRIAGTPGFKLIETPETRTIFLAFDHASEELKHADVKGRNPLRDPRVRRAFLLAIDVDALIRAALRGKGTPAGLLIGPQIAGHDAAADRRPSPDPAAGKALMAEAGYPDGFALTLDCPNDRFVNDEQVCTALAPMLARIGVRVNVNAMPRSIYFRKLADRDSSFFLLGWAPGTLDAHHTLRFIVRSRDPARGLGSWNYGGFADPAIDDLIDRIAVEQDPAARDAMIRRIWARMADSAPFVPLYHQTVSWAHRDGITVGQRADDYFELALVRMSPR